MTGPELKSTLSALSLSQVAFARILGANTRTVQRWITGEYKPVPEYATFAVEAMQKSEDVLEMAREMSGR